MWRRWAVEDGIFLPLPPKLTNANLSGKALYRLPFHWISKTNKQKLCTAIFSHASKSRHAKKTSENRET